MRPGQSLEVNLWLQTMGLPSRKWICGHCGSATGNNIGYFANNRPEKIYLCSACARPTFFEGDKQVPGATFGMPVKNLPKDVESLYDEARNSVTANAFTAAVLLCRKILMHIAVERNAERDKSFIYYIDYLTSGSILPTQMKAWLDRIRTRGNEANHELVLMGQDDASTILKFTQMALTLLYEFPTQGATAP